MSRPEPGVPLWLLVLTLAAFVSLALLLHHAGILE
jgi:hypothetical protein